MDKGLYLTVECKTSYLMNLFRFWCAQYGVAHNYALFLYNTVFFDSFLGECAFQVYISIGFLHCHLD